MASGATQTVRAQAVGPVSRGAAQRVQRYYNRGTGRMETAQQMHGAHPQPHQVSRTTSTTRTSSAAVRSAPAFNLLTATPAQIEARAKAITTAEMAGERLPFQQRNTQLGQERTGAVAGTRSAYSGLEAKEAGQRAQQGEQAKTQDNEAADRVLKAEAANPKATAGMSESERNRAEADRTFLIGLATSAQGGTNARQQAETNFLTSLGATTGLRAQGAAENVENVFGKAMKENTDREAQAEARASGRVGKYIDALEGEQAKLRIAAGGLGIKEGALRVNEAKQASTTENQRAQRQGEQQKIQQGNVKLEQSARALASKEATEKARRGYYNAQAKKLLSQAAAPGGKPLTTQQLNQYSGEAASIFNFIQNSAIKGDYGSAAKALQEGGYKGTIISKGKEIPGHIKIPFKIKEPLLIQVALESINHGYVSPAVKAQLRAKGLPESGWSELLYRGAGRSRPAQPVTGGVNAGGRRK